MTLGPLVGKLKSLVFRVKGVKHLNSPVRGWNMEGGKVVKQGKEVLGLKGREVLRINCK